FLFDLQQAAGTHLSRRLLYWTVRPPLRIDRIHVPEVGDLLAQAGKAFWNVSHNYSIRLKLSSVLISSRGCTLRKGQVRMGSSRQLCQIPKRWAVPPRLSGRNARRLSCAFLGAT